MNRRTLLQLCATALTWPGWLAAQPARRFRIGFLAATNETATKPFRDAFVAGLREHGYFVGRNLAIDERYAEGNYDHLPVLAGELIALNPDVLVTAIEPAAVAMRGKTTTIPIVLIASTNAVASGLVQSLSRPGTNVTGLSFRFDELIAKQFELLAEINPRMSRVGLFNHGVSDLETDLSARYEQYAKKAASAMGLTLVVVAAGDAQGVRQAFVQLAQARTEGLIVAASGFTWQFRNEIIREAQRLRLPSITALPAAWADLGGLATYGPSFLYSFRYSATYVDRIFKGAKPADLPVEQIANFEFVINLKTAKALGLTIPQSVLLRADRIVE